MLRPGPSGVTPGSPVTGSRINSRIAPASMTVSLSSTSCGPAPASSALGDTDDARTTVAQEHERVVARAVPIRPDGRQGVRADQVSVHQPGLLRGERWGGVEPAR